MNFKIITIAVFLILIRGVFLYVESQQDLNLHEGDLTISGCISEEPNVKERSVQYVLRADDVNFLIFTYRYPEYRYGDCLMISGKLVNPEFNYLLAKGIYRVFYFPEIQTLSERKANIFFELIYGFKREIREILQNIFPASVSGIIEGLLVGERGLISEDVLDDFRKSGLTHILAVSGYNVTIIITAMGSVFGFINQRRRIFLSIFLIFIFIILVGLSASAVRAGIMGIISLVAILFNRKYVAKVALIFTAFVMTLINPYSLLFDAGFQLSFLATAGIIFIFPRINKYFNFIPWKNFREIITVSLSAQIAVLPLILYQFKGMSLVFLIANIVVLPLIPLVMLMSFLALIAGFLWSPFGKIIAYSGYVILKFINLFVGFLAELKFSYLEISEFPLWVCALMYAIIFILFRRLKSD